MEKTIIQFGYCPVKKREYFISVGYNLCDINLYKKCGYECFNVTYFKNECTFKGRCPIEESAPELIES
jgi:hypothetical protein